MVVREYTWSGAQLIFKKLKALPKYSNYKQLKQYKQALWDKGINIKIINVEGAYIVKKDRLLFAKNKSKEDTDFKYINVNNGLKFSN